MMPTYGITFESPDRKRKFFPVNEVIYNLLIKNDEGLLMYKQDMTQLWLIDFQVR